MRPSALNPKNPLNAMLRYSRFAMVLAGLMVLGFLGACSDLNPVRWLGNDSTAPPPPGAEEGFPNLATVPETPRKGSTPEEIRKIREGLIADRESARYTDNELRNTAVDEIDFAALARAEKTRAEALAATSAAKAASESEAAASAAPMIAILPFAPNSTELSNDAIEHLGQLAVKFGQVGGTLRVVGYAAAPAKDGATLAHDRALVVAGELKRLGVASERVHVIDADPADSVAEDRVDVVIEP